MGQLNTGRSLAREEGSEQARHVLHSWESLSGRQGAEPGILPLGVEELCSTEQGTHGGGSGTTRGHYP